MACDAKGIKELIVVEGEKDAQVVRRAVPYADVITTGGWHLSERLIKELQQAQRRRGVIVLTDPDHAGRQIRQKLMEKVPGCKHAYLSRKQAEKKGKTGVEYSSPATVSTVLAALQTRGSSHREFTMEDLYTHNLAGAADASCRRRQLGELLSVGYANGKNFLWRLNALGVTRKEFNQAVGRLGDYENGCSNDSR